MQFMRDGGPVMYALLLAAILGGYALLERIYYFTSKEKHSFAKLDEKLIFLLENNKIKEAVLYLNDNKSSSAKVVKEILKFIYKDKKETLTALEEKGKEVALNQLKVLEKNMWLMSLVANVSPLLGLLGTVTGMIKVFSTVAVHGTGDPSILASGISEALITTASGLMIAIPFVIFYNYFNRRVDLIVNDMEKTSSAIINYFRR